MLSTATRATRLRIFVEPGRPSGHGAVLLAATFTDEELLGIDVRWICRHSTLARRAVVVPAEPMVTTPA